MKILKEELTELAHGFGDERRTEIVADQGEFSIEDLIAEEDMVITVSHAGYIKRLPVSAYRRQRRGGKGVISAHTKEDDWVEHLFIASTHDYVMFFTQQGQCYWLKVHEIPQAARAARGKSTLLAVTEKGMGKRSELDEYRVQHRGGRGIITLKRADKTGDIVALKEVLPDDELMMITKKGIMIRVPVEGIRISGRNTQGVKIMNLTPGDLVVDVARVVKEDEDEAVDEDGDDDETPRSAASKTKAPGPKPKAPSKPKSRAPKPKK